MKQWYLEQIKYTKNTTLKTFKDIVEVIGVLNDRIKINYQKVIQYYSTMVSEIIIHNSCHTDLILINWVLWEITGLLLMKYLKYLIRNYEVVNTV